MVTNFSPIAQLVERLTVNQLVPGSSPGRGAKFKKSPHTEGFFVAQISAYFHRQRYATAPVGAAVREAGESVDLELQRFTESL